MTIFLDMLWGLITALVTMVLFQLGVSVDSNDPQQQRPAVRRTAKTPPPQAVDTSYVTVRRPQVRQAEQNGA
jgi:hypothetical protein